MRIIGEEIRRSEHTDHTSPKGFNGMTKLYDWNKASFKYEEKAIM